MYGANLTGLATMIADIRVVCPLLTVARMMSPNIPFYVSTFPRTSNLTDADDDAAAILGFFPREPIERERHLSSIQKLFDHYVWNNVISQVDNLKRVLIIDQDPLPQKDYPNCNFWIQNGIVPAYARVD